MLCTCSIFYGWAHMLHSRKDVCPELNYYPHIQIIIFHESLIKLLLQYCCRFKIKWKPDTVFLYICIYGAAYFSATGGWIYLTDIYWALTCVRISAQGSKEVSQTYLILRIIHNTFFFLKSLKPNPNLLNQTFQVTRAPHYSYLLECGKHCHRE